MRRALGILAVAVAALGLTLPQTAEIVVECDKHLTWCDYSSGSGEAGLWSFSDVSAGWPLLAVDVWRVHLEHSTVDVMLVVGSDTARTQVRCGGRGCREVNR